jgi:nicotinamide-nucleotide amidase
MKGDPMMIKAPRSLLEIADFLAKKNLTVALAESFTGGGLAAAMTSIPGSSAWFQQGWVVYSEAAKKECLSVPLSLIEQQGVVSKAVAQAMTDGVLRHSSADIALATTGLAGPGDGGTGLSVGQGWLAVQQRGRKVRTLHHRWPGDRSDVRQQAIEAACDFLWAFISEKKNT